MRAPRLCRNPDRIETIRPINSITILIGLGLLSINLFGLTQTVRHPDLVAFDEGRAGPGRMSEIAYGRMSSGISKGIRMTRTAALAAYAKDRNIPDEAARIRRIQEIVTESTVHFYPVNTPGTAFAIPFHENFISWGLALLSPFLVRLGFATLDPNFGEIDKLWRKSFGSVQFVESAFIDGTRHASAVSRLVHPLVRVVPGLLNLYRFAHTRAVLAQEPI